ncbi:MAG: hypothetical protein HY401_03050 [Elusimicrobia bacterium]|nr:hypothetical protein [Elusimicrobiota bacterium]
MAMGAPSVGSSGFIRPENRWRVQTLVLAGGLVAGTVIGHLPYAIIPDDRARLVARKYTAAAALAGALGGFLVNGSSRDDTGAVTLGAPTRMVLSTAAGALFGIGGALLMGGFRDGDRATMAVFYAVSGAVAAFFSSGSVEISRKI